MYHFICLYSKTPQMAPSKLANPADWRLVLGHHLQNSRHFPQNFHQIQKLLSNWCFCSQIEIQSKVIFLDTIFPRDGQNSNQVLIRNSNFLNQYFNYELKYSKWRIFLLKSAEKVDFRILFGPKLTFQYCLLTSQMADFANGGICLGPKIRHFRGFAVPFFY